MIFLFGGDCFPVDGSCFRPDRVLRVGGGMNFRVHGRNSWTDGILCRAGLMLRVFSVVLRASGGILFPFSAALLSVSGDLFPDGGVILPAGHLEPSNGRRFTTAFLSPGNSVKDEKFLACPLIGGLGFRAMKLSHGLHLAYCTNIHRGETWAQTFDTLQKHTLAVRDRVSPGKPYAIGLRLGADAARELSDPAALKSFRAWLDKENCYVFTINGFPYGKFMARE